MGNVFSSASRSTATGKVASSAPSGLLQRKCACGQHTIAGGECALCRKKRGAAGPYDGIPGKSPLSGKSARPVGPNRSVNGFESFLDRVPDVAPVVQRKAIVSSPGDPLEREADEVADRVMRMADPASLTSSPPAIQRGCASCAQDDDEKKPIQAKRSSAANGEAEMDTDLAVRTATHGGSPLPAAARSYFEPRFGQDFGHVRVHTDTDSAQAARSVQARAYTLGSDMVFGDGQFSPATPAGQHLIAHELTHVLQQRGKHSLQRYGDPIPTVERPSVHSMVDFIALVRRIEAANPGMTALQIATLIMRTKYHSQGFDYLLPSSAHARSVAATGSVTGDDVTTLSGEFDVTLPQGGLSDPTHVVTAIVAGAEKQMPGAGGSAGLAGRMIQALPQGVTQRDVATWVGDIASAAAEWHIVHPHPKGGTTRQSYMDEFAPESDLIGDIDGIVLTSTTKSNGFAFDAAVPLSANLEHFYFPQGAREGKNRRFHAFCAIEGFALQSDGVTLSDAAIGTMNERVRLNADWFERNDPNLLAWVAIQGQSGSLFNPISRAWVDRAQDWRWFADQFRSFLQRNLKAEGP